MKPMARIAMFIIGGLVCSTVPITYAQQSGAQVAAEAMARAQAEKARNDRIVEQQRAAERAQKDTKPAASPSGKSKEGKSTSDKSKPEKSKPDKK
jgi:uncharacterized low-complexity protein